MKIKVKGLVFVGFAAAILSASAMADPSGTTITSLAYTENTYQKKDTAVTHTANTAAGSLTKPVYINASGVATETTYTLGQNVPVPASGDDSKFLKGDGTWATPTGTTYSDFTGTNGTADGAHGLVPAPTTNDADKVLGSSGSWVGVNNTGSVASNATAADNKDLVTEYTLSNTINGINNTINSLPSSSIPGKSSLCTATLPCALVAETSGFHWRVMAVSNDNTIQTTAAGTLADYCTANTDCPTGATCNTTGGANVCVEQ